MPDDRSTPASQVVITPARGIEQPLLDRLRVVATLTATWTVRDLRARYRQSVLRWSWSLLQPLTILATYGWVMTAVLDVSSDDAPYLTFAWTGIVFFTFFSQSLGQGVGSIHQAGGIVSRVYFPREVLPLAVVGGALVDLLVMITTLLITAWVQVGPPSVHLIALIPVAVILCAWTAAATLLASALTTFRRDLNFAIPLALRVLFIATPVMYPAALVAKMSPLLIDLNPLAVLIEAARDAVYRQVWPDTWLLSGHFTASILTLVVVYGIFRRLEPRMADYA